MTNTTPQFFSSCSLLSPPKAGSHLHHSNKNSLDKITKNPHLINPIISSRPSPYWMYQEYLIQLLVFSYWIVDNAFFNLASR